MKQKTKRMLSAFLSVLLLAVTFVPSLNVFAEQTATVTGDVVNVRSGPGSQYNAIAQLSEGTTVTVLDTSNATWYKIRTPGGIEGYMSSEFLQLNGSGSNPSQPPSQYAQTTADVNLRSGAGTGYSVVTVLSSGTLVTVLEVTNSEWVKVRTSGGSVGYLYSEYISYVSGNSGSITISQSAVTIPKGKTVILTASAQNYSSGLIWSTENSQIATVSGGFVYAAGVGQTKIMVKDTSGSNTAVCTVSVTAPEVAKFAYVSPNIACVNETVKLIAITDTLPEKMRFVVHGDTDQVYETSSYTVETSEAREGFAENVTRVWTKEVTFTKSGTYKVDVYCCRKGIWSVDYKTMTAAVSAAADDTVTTLENRRPSDKILQIIANFEGFTPTIMDDPLVSGYVPTFGHGYVLRKDENGHYEQYYNNLTRREAWAMLCYVGNTYEFSTKLNDFLSRNKIKANQQQFDSMFSFAYNIGAGHWTASDFTPSKLLLNSVDLSTLNFSSKSYAGTILETANVYSSVNSSSPATYLSAGTSVTVLDAQTIFTGDTHAIWYKIRTSGGNTYYIKNVYVTLSGSFTRDLQYCDAVAYGSEMLLWHHAGGVCYWGLLYRRLAEAKIFSFGKYEEASMTNANYTKNEYGYHYPSCIS